MSIRAKAFWAIVLTIGLAVAYRACGVDLPPLPPDGPRVYKSASGTTQGAGAVALKALPPRVWTNSIAVYWDQYSNWVAVVEYAAKPAGPWRELGRTNTPPLRARLTNSAAFFRARWE